MRAQGPRKARPGRGAQRGVSASWAEAESWARAAVPEVVAAEAGTPAEAFELLYLRHSRPLLRQAFLLCGHRRIAERAVFLAFHAAWEQWPDVARDPDPGGWVRAVVYDYALSPWHRLRPGRRRPEAYAGPPADRALLGGLLALPASYRSTLLLHDGLGLSPVEVAAATQASAGAAAGRLRHARAALTGHVPELRDAPAERREALLADRLRELADAQPARRSLAHTVRFRAEQTTRLRTRAAVCLAAAVTAATAFTLATSDDAGPAAPDGRPAQIRTPHGAGGPGSAYLPQLRSDNARVTEGR